MLIGPFTQVVTMAGLSAGGPLRDDQLQIIDNAGIRVRDEQITAVGDFDDLRLSEDDEIMEVSLPAVAFPGLVDAHTHICFAGNRAHDYALRLGGCSYQEILEQGGGILDTVLQTRAASRESLATLVAERCQVMLNNGVTTCEVKSGYGLSVEDEVKILEAIQDAASLQPVHLLPTCLAAHAKPWEFATNDDYLHYLVDELLPLIKEKELSKRIDIFVEQGAFTIEEARSYLNAAKNLGFSITVHGDQFSRGGTQLAAELGAISVDHLEESTEADARAIYDANVAAVVLPGASMGLGQHFAPARMLLNNGVTVAIASDWNPGSAPMGDLLVQAAIFGAAQKLTMAETWAALTFRAAHALGLDDRGVIQTGKRSDIVAFPCETFQEVLYCQGAMKASVVIVDGNCALLR